MQKIPQINNEDIKHFIERDERILAGCILGGGYTSDANAKRIFGIKKGPKLFFHNADVFLRRDSHENFEIEIKKKISNPKYIDQLVKSCHSDGKNIISVTKDISAQAEKSTSKAKLADAFERYYTETKRYCGYYAVPTLTKPMTELAENIARSYAKNKKEKEKIFALITTPAQLTGLDEEQDDFLFLLSRYRKGENIISHARDHSEKYGWIGLRYFRGLPWTQKDILKRVRSSTLSDPDAVLRRRKEEREKTKNELKKFAKKITTEENNHIRHVRDIVSLRTQRSEYFEMAAIFVYPLLRKISDSLAVLYDDLLYLKPEEVLKSLRLNKDYSDEIRERKEDFMILFTGEGEASALSGKNVKIFIKEHPNVRRIAKEVNQLKGVVAYRGTARGRVAIVKKDEDLHHVKRGDILVTVMTFPNFISAMEKASAFVTDEGGILCHAAIIAREMKKPCIIGTKIATKVLKDGDLVEVDANRGVVKILRKGVTK